MLQRLHIYDNALPQCSYLSRSATDPENGPWNDPLPHLITQKSSGAQAHGMEPSVQIVLNGRLLKKNKKEYTAPEHGKAS